jgi:hypothetical protein
VKRSVGIRKNGIGQHFINFPSAFFYVIQPEFVHIIAVMHHSRDQQHWQKREN